MHKCAQADIFNVSHVSSKSPLSPSKTTLDHEDERRISLDRHILVYLVYKLYECDHLFSAI